MRQPTLIFECAAPTIKAASGSATTIVPATGDVDASAADDAFNNAVLVLKEKAANSGNTDALGTQIVVTDYAKTGTVMTKASGGVPGAGDVYQVYPVIGAAIGGVASLGDKRLGITLKTVGATKLRCIGHDYERGAIKLMAIGPCADLRRRKRKCLTILETGRPTTTNLSARRSTLRMPTASTSSRPSWAR